MQYLASVVCCILTGTTTRELEALRAWLTEHGVTHLGMESTAVE